ncbi:hypothetical protein BGX26_000798 [Mortierella sp. AD094]|nr:hypothetical protein BGX26_000798 [Mortierella sp. AD094]
MEGGKSISIFNIPEILVMISQYLTSHDMAMTRATCKNLAHQLEPIMWKHLHVRDHPPLQDSVLRNRHHIETLYISSLNTHGIIALSCDLLSPPTTTEIKLLNPTSMDITSMLISEAEPVQPPVNSPIPVLRMMQHIEVDTTIVPEQLLPILNHCPNLTHLEISTSSIFDQGLFQDSLRNNLRQLLHLSLTGPTVQLETALPLLHVCLLHPRLQELILAFHLPILKRDLRRDAWESGQFSSILEALKNSSDLSGPFRSNITSLTLPTYHKGYPISFLEPLLKDHLFNIERFTVPMLEGYGDEDEDEDLPILEAYRGLCPKLQHLTCVIDEGNFDTTYLESFINESYTNGIGLKTFRIYNHDDGDFVDILEPLIELHSDTLEEIELIDCVMVQSSILQSIFTMCENLRRFWATPGNNGSIELRFSDIVREEWVCLEMRELRLNLIPDDPNDIPHNATDLATPMAKKVYAQIGRLVKLEKLSLGHDLVGYAAMGYKDLKNDLTLERGWLAELAGLSKLRHFHMMTDFWSKMGKAEVEFMHANWTHLERITFGEDNIMSRYTIDEPHWRWLKEQRPGLIFDYDDYE